MLFLTTAMNAESRLGNGSYDTSLLGQSQVTLGEQGKHDFAVHRQGGPSQHCCGESPRAFGQRVPAGDCEASAVDAGGDTFGGGAVSWLGPFAAAQPCRERMFKALTERGSLSPCLPSSQDIS